MPENFIAQLVALRDHYQGLLAEQERNILYLQQTVNHLNGLMENPLFPGPGENIDVLNGFGTTADLLPSLPSAPKAASETSRKAGSKSTRKHKSTRKPPEKDQGPRGKGPETVLPLLPQFSGLSKISAVAEILSAHAGQVLHIDEIIQLLLGDLSEGDLKAERGRIKDTLYRGTTEKRWIKFQGKPQSYTLDESLLDKAKIVSSVDKKKPAGKRKATKPARKSKQNKQQKGNQREWRPEYRALNLTAAVTQILKAHRGKVMTAEGVAEELFEAEHQFSQQDWAAIKKQIGTVLSKGLSMQQWQRLANQRGAYILK
ncbi:MAG: hypothetical protein HC934_02575 [Acaryochloridaceae cyanobacterium SU_2_1]|nr:hypothetical protein [Acaryochloridaceae cyanobacterium SU_2_1]